MPPILLIKLRMSSPTSSTAARLEIKKVMSPTKLPEDEFEALVELLGIDSDVEDQAKEQQRVKVLKQRHAAQGNLHVDRCVSFLSVSYIS